MNAKFNSIEDMGFNPKDLNTKPVQPNSVLRQAAFKPKGSSEPAPAPEIAKPTEKVSAKPVAAPQNIKNPYGYLQDANIILHELANLNSQKPDTLVSLKDSNGSIIQKPAKDIVLALKAELNHDCQTAIGNADAISQTGIIDKIDSALKTNNQEVSALAKSLNLDPQKLNLQDLVKAKEQAIIGSSQQQDLAKLTTLVQQDDELSALKDSPATTRLFYAQAILNGFTQISTNPNQIALGQPNHTDLLDAHLLLSQAGRLSNEVKNSPIFLNIQNELMAKLNPNVKPTDQPNSQNHTAGAITDNNTATTAILQAVQNANKLSAAGKNQEATKAYEQAMTLSKNINIANCVAKFQTAMQKSDKTTAVEEAKTIQVKEQAKLDYANFLEKNGDYDKALKLAIELKSDDALKLVANDSSLNTIFSQALFGKAQSSGDLSVDESNFQKALNSKDFSTAQAQLNTLKEAALKTYQQVEKGNKVLTTQEIELKAKLANLAKDNALSQNQKQFETHRLETQLQLNQEAQGINKQASNQYPYTVYLSGILAAAQGKRNEAHSDFLTVQNDYPDFAKASSIDFTKLIDQTKQEGWFDRNWTSIKDGLCIAAGVGAGLGAAALTIWSGPGAAIAGLETGTVVTTALIGAAALGSSAIAGGAAYTAAHAGFGDKVGLSTFGQGALLGVEGGATVASFGLGAGAIGASAVADTTVAGVAASSEATAITGASAITADVAGAGAGVSGDVATASTIGADVTTAGTATADAGSDLANVAQTSLKSDSSFLSKTASQGVKFANKMGLSRYSLGVGLGTQGTVQGFKVALGQENLKQAAINTAELGIFTAMPLGWASNAGKAAVTAGLTGSNLMFKAMTTAAIQSNFFPNAPLISTTIPIAIDAYKNYSPVEIDGLVRSGQTLNMQNQNDSNLFWQRMNQLNPELTNPTDQ